VLLVYTDETYWADRYYIVGIVCPDIEAISLAKSLDSVVEEASYEYGGVSKEAELHGHDLVGGKHDWERLKPKLTERIAIYMSAMQAIAEHDVPIVIRGVDRAGLARRYGKSTDPYSVVMTHLLERIDEYAAERGDLALMIADEVAVPESYRQDLRRYQEHGTWGYRARVLTRVVDTLHFAPSSASRLLQAADLVAYMYQKVKRGARDERATRANEAIWAIVAPKIRHMHCWHPD
jgi:hypothetical protein